MAHILERDPEWKALPPAVQPALLRLLGRCLEKDPKRRLRDAGDLALALEDMEVEQPVTEAEPGRPGPKPITKILPWLVAAAALILAIVGWIGRSSRERPTASTALRFTQSSPAALDIARTGHFGSAVAISPDGHVLAWVGATDESTQLFARHLDEDEVRPIPGTEGGLAPFFSPDSEWIGFWADEKLKKVAVRGGAPQTICEMSHVHGASWGDRMIVMSAVGDGTLWWVDPAGGQIKRREISNDPDYRGEYPRMLPGVNAMLVSSQGTFTVDLVSLDTGEVTTLVSEGTNGSYLPSGHLVWTTGDNLLAAPFDLASRTITGEARTVVEGILTEAHMGFTSHYAVSDEGTLAYHSGTTDAGGHRPAWVRLDGTTEPLSLPADAYLSPRISPDGRRLLLGRQATTRGLWIAEPDRGVLTPVTSDDSNQYWAIWTSDGTGMVFNQQQGSDPANLWMVSASSPTGFPSSNGWFP